MSPIPGYCNHCATLFARDGVVSARNTTISLTKTSTNCPRCDRMADLVDGTFYFDAQENVRIQSAPLRTILIVSAYIASRQIETNRVDEVPLLQSASLMPEALGELAKQALRSGGVPKYLSMMLMALSLMVGASSIHGKVDINILVDQVRTGLTGATPYPGLTYHEAEPTSEASEAETTEVQKPEPSLSKRQQRRQRGRTRMQQKQTNRSTLPRKKT